ncbi:hypothetical protein BELL_0238g00070 [Botrytis elliptica]|uniref:Uncharacterized protein n=1 Tax=Botrytis elliptica TaxID=278938 RepID=A0A4Z1JNK9_9HELO|nr:hypothetical protein EAE99_004947 [Botrytis elliptica]TGO75046.1 hypothetical protein BELL_0238g00070 [Botrytis elliptica]
MASSAGARSIEADLKKKKKRILADALLALDEISSNKLAGAHIEPNTYQNLEKMAPYLGLPNANAVTKFLESPEFRPWFNELYQSAIYPRTLKAPNTKGPSLLQVQKNDHLRRVIWSSQVL